MGRLLIVSREEQLKECRQISKEYNVGFEINDFFNPDVLDDEKRIEEIIGKYRQGKIPDGSTMHGAFLDVTVFSQDAKIRQISEMRMEQSMEIAKRLGVKGVVFHTNGNPFLEGVKYDNRVVDFTAGFLEDLLARYPEIDIYLENMFDRTPDILQRISKRLCGYSNYGVCFDYAHASIYGVEMEVWIAALSDYVRHIHINDNDLQHDLHLAVGEGLLDWEQFEVYYRRYFQKCSVLIETLTDKNQRKSLEYLKNQTGIMKFVPGGAM